jgi:hypothetical protein
VTFSVTTPALSGVLVPTSGAAVFSSGGLVRLLCDAPADSGGAPVFGFVVEALLESTDGSPVYGEAWAVVPTVISLSGSVLSGDSSAAVWRALAALLPVGGALSNVSIVASATFGNGSDATFETGLGSAAFSLQNSSGWGPLRHDAFFAALAGTPLAPALSLPTWANTSQGRGAAVRWLVPPAAALALVIDPPTGLMPVIFGEVTAGEGLGARSVEGTIEPLQPKGWLHDGT